MNLQFILLQTGSEILHSDIANKMMYLSLAAMKDVPWQLVLRGISKTTLFDVVSCIYLFMV